MGEAYGDILRRLPGKDCGQCGFKTCAGLAAYAVAHPQAIRRCVYLVESAPAPPALAALDEEAITWQDMLGREYDFVLEQYPGDPGPRETILPFNPANVERLAINKGSIVYGRPAWVGCPVTHVGQVMEEPDRLNGVIVWCVVGPLAARQGGVEIGLYNPIAYEGIVRHTRVPLEIGRRYFFLPRACMLQSRHSGVASALAKRPEGLRARLEGIWIA